MKIKTFYNIVVSLALILVVLGIVLFFGMYPFSMAVIILGFLLLSIHTLSTVRFQKPKLRDFIKIVTVLLFVAVAVCFALDFSWFYWLLILGVLLQIVVSISGLLIKD